jgi:hypothetical protein
MFLATNLFFIHMAWPDLRQVRATPIQTNFHSICTSCVCFTVSLEAKCTTFWCDWGDHQVWYCPAFTLGMQRCPQPASLFFFLLNTSLRFHNALFVIYTFEASYIRTGGCPCFSFTTWRTFPNGTTFLMRPVCCILYGICVISTRKVKGKLLFRSESVFSRNL